MTEEQIVKKLSALEALLFVHGEPLSYKKISAVLGFGKSEAEEAVAELAKRLADDPSRGIALIADREKAQLATKPAFAKILEDFVKEEVSADLTPASLETLSIIAYLGPISRAKLEYLRGVNSAVILRSLMIRGLVERISDAEHTNSFLYQTTLDLMKHLGVAKNDELPEYARFRELLNVFEEQNPMGEGGGNGGGAQAGTAPAEPVQHEQ